MSHNLQAPQITLLYQKFPGGGRATKKDQKIVKKDPIMPLPGGEGDNEKKD